MTDGHWLEFADRASGLRGWLMPGVALLFEGERELFAGPGDVSVAVEGGGGRAELRSESLSATVEVRSAAEPGPVSAGPASVELELDGKRRSIRGAGGFGAADLDGELVRTLLALREDGSSLALRSTRPQGARDHAAEHAEAWLLEGDGAEPRVIEEPLLSTEYDSGGVHSRAGLELWMGGDDELPLRGAGTRVAGAELAIDGWRIDAALFDWSVEGIEGAGSYLIWRRADG